MDKDDTKAGAQERPDAGDVGTAQKGYEKHLEKARADHGQKLDGQLKALEKLSQKYEKAARKGADAAGLDVEAMRADFQAAAEGDQDGALARFDKARATWATRLDKAVTATGVDPKQGAAEAKAVLGDDVPKELDVAGTRDADRLLSATGLVGYSINIGSWWIPPPPPPPPPPSVSTLTIPKPYTLGSTTGSATADRNTGRLSSYNNVMVGSQQQLASVGGSFAADAAVRRIRVETIVDASYWTNIGAIWGYASAEVILNLKVLDGATLRGSQRLSLVRTISAVLWVSSDSGSGAYTLACEFDHAYGTPKTYAALVELETWAGGGGLLVISPATASGTATPRNVTVTLMR
ncbi:hypothetical protein [Humibacillus xanthopallidus]|uniref:Uncharacterized protein n=1 Tax=Humibacillus xanthopallidus TaxID=412689 RepID=A0A543HHM7_9MICO|nr:hypothetical protein [Humibacillus xanthopallidus]TQM57828.1 hypothetical protein FBY41_3163 [Humibacillus xanthopallidus]